MDNTNLKIAVISNIIFEPYFMPIVRNQFNNNVIVLSIPYNEHTEQEYYNQLINSNIIIVWLNFELMFPNYYNEIISGSIKIDDFINDFNIQIERLHSDLIMEQTNKYIIWCLFEDYYMNMSTVLGYKYIYDGLIDKINIKIIDTLRTNEIMSFIDLKHLIAKVGISNAYDSKGKYRWNAPYSKVLMEVAVKDIYKQYIIKRGITPKCLVLDCDNVLWGGILSEDGIENLKLGGSGFGRLYQDFQRFILSLYYHGVILAICSKNDLLDVMTVFNDHNEMILKKEHIACFQVNWENKPDNIKKISETLNISLDSMVFVDDSPIEIESVISLLPEVTAILYERNSIYDRLSCFNLEYNVSVTDIEKRNETFQTNPFRENLKAQYENYDDYITALEMKINIHEALSIEFNRISELTQRTNKCTNGKRYTVAELKEKTQNTFYKLFSVTVSDKFSNLGLVGAIGIDNESLDLFALSCRALGRNIENKMLKFIIDNDTVNKISFIKGNKNESLEALLKTLYKDN